MSLKLRIGLRVKAARQAKSLTQAQLAEALDKAVETISNIERGAALTGLDTLQQISGILGVKVGYFFEGVEDREAVSIKRLRTEEEMLATARTLADSDLQLALSLVAAVARERR